MTRLSRRVLATMLLAVLPAGTSAVAATASNDAMRAMYDPLSASEKPRERVLAALMLAPSSDDERTAQRAQLIFAAAAAPQDPLVQWLAANATTGCPKAVEQTASLRLFARLEPDNAAADLLQLNLDAACGDNVKIGAALLQMAQAKRFDSHFGTVLQAWLAVLERQPEGQALLRAYAGTRMSEPLVLALKLTSAAAEPVFQPLLDICAKGGAARANACGKIGRILAYNSKTALDRSVGFTLIAGAGGLTTADKMALRELHWLMTPPTTAPGGASLGKQVAGGWHSEDDEMVVLRLAFEAAGLPTTPPAGWVDPADKPLH